MKRALTTGVMALVLMLFAWQTGPGCSPFTGVQQGPNDITGEPGVVAEEQVAPQESATVFCPPEVDDTTGEPKGRWLSLTGKPLACAP